MANTTNSRGNEVAGTKEDNIWSKAFPENSSGILIFEGCIPREMLLTSAQGIKVTKSHKTGQNKPKQGMKSGKCVAGKIFQLGQVKMMCC